MLHETPWTVAACCSPQEAHAMQRVTVSLGYMKFPACHGVACRLEQELVQPEREGLNASRH